MSIPLGSLLPERDEKQTSHRSDVTGSIPMQLAAASPDRDMTRADWTHATTALREALDGPGDAVSIPWQNSATGAQGTVTPISAAFVEDGFPCRNFLTSYLNKGREAWFEGTACRVHRGRWDIRSTRPLQKT